MVMTFRPAHLSVSSVALYTRCPLAYKLRYVDRVLEPASPAMLTGLAFHAALERDHRGGSATRVWLDGWNAIEANGITPVMDKTHGLELLELFRARGFGGMIGEPERRFKLPFPSSMIPVPLLGYLDLAIPKQRVYRDYKTHGGNQWNATRVALEPQLHVYGWAYQGLYRHRPERAQWLIFSTREVTLDVYEAIPSADGFRLFEMQAEACWRGITHGDYTGCGLKTCAACTPPDGRPIAGPLLEIDQ